ncbi:MAG: hypothetical protein E5Y63_06235 [Mesorhizobium sp.]|nr:MAG: hypothetical protein E5Y63_06235 [Mesorhizobium sp.]TIN95470.1 MAG: hypothetical protein E5Y06_12000 [Mesorhizobium sp.]TJU97116.1 MAG: hypothetical protein E5Y08_18590 [Mesorhizobium sp.]
MISASSPHHCGLDGDRQAGGDRRGIACDRSFSGGWQPVDFVVSRGMTAQPAGEESRSAPLPHRRSRRSRPSVRSGH